MKLYCVYTPAHEVLYREWFLPWVPEGFEVVAAPLPMAGAGDFLSDEFLNCIRAKLALMIQSIRGDRGAWIVWSDVDILLFPGVKEAMEATVDSAGEKNVFFQRETRSEGEVNTGFILIRCGDEAEAFFQEVAARLERERDKNEQAVENAMLREGGALRWGYLPVDFVARTHGWPPPRRMSIYHANYTLGKHGVEQKIRQFRRIRAMERFGMPAILYFIAVRALEIAIRPFLGR